MQNIDQHTSENDQGYSLNSLSWTEKNGFPGWVMGLGWAIGAFALFQIVAGILAIVILISSGRISLENLDQNALFENLDILFISNSIGQILFLGGMTWIITSLSASRENKASFLRLQSNSKTKKNMGLAFVLLLAVQPVIFWLSWLNLQFPFSESYLAFEESQLKIIENYLRSDHIVLLTIFHIGVVPAFCEELLFRGYILRNFERSMLPWLAIILSGLIFGLFHIRLTQFIPLALLGIIMAWMTIETRSIWPAVVAHFVNNAGSVLAATYFPEIVMDDSIKDVMPPLYLVGLSIIVTYFIIQAMKRINIQPDEGENHVQRYKT
ncbi:MAG TPA: hypothetical protein DCE78_03825 [Bacteroidetes bacterium]|nr:hypothetical protein [Bacteroidota bacterium]